MTEVTSLLCDGTRVMVPILVGLRVELFTVLFRTMNSLPAPVHVLVIPVVVMGLLEKVRMATFARQLVTEVDGPFLRVTPVSSPPVMWIVVFVLCTRVCRVRTRVIATFLQWVIIMMLESLKTRLSLLIIRLPRVSLMAYLMPGALFWSLRLAVGRWLAGLPGDGFETV